RLDAGNTTNTGTLAAGSQLDINGNISNSNLLYAGNLLTIDGSVSNTANIYSNGNASIAGSSITNSGGSIAAARDLSISGSIVNTYNGDFSYTNGTPTTSTVYPDGNYHFNTQPYYGPTKTWGVIKEVRVSKTYEASLNGQAGVIAAGGNLSLSGSITNDFSTISASGNLLLSGSSLVNNNGQNKVESEVSVIEENWEEECLQGLTQENGNYWCAVPGEPRIVSETVRETYSEVIYTGGGS